MNYQKIHDAIINRAKTRTLTGYKERHHIVPRCMGGDNSKSNLVDLTAREHFIVHKLLCEIYPDDKKLHDAIWCMIHLVNKQNHSRDYVVSNREYEYFKKIRSTSLSKRMKGKNNPFYGKTHTDENKKIFRENARKLHTGKKRTNETKKNISQGLLNSKKFHDALSSYEYKLKLSNTVSNIWKNADSVYNSIEYRAKLKRARENYIRENPTVDLVLLKQCLLDETKSFAAALRLYNSKSIKVNIEAYI